MAKRIKSSFSHQCILTGIVLSKMSSSLIRIEPLPNKVDITLECSKKEGEE